MRVNLDSKALTDPRFRKLARAFTRTWQEVLGRCLQVWMVAYEQRWT